MKPLKVKCFFIWLILFRCVDGLEASVVEGPITNTLTGHFYYIIAPESWSNAQTEAHVMGGHLATIRSVAENNWIITNLLADFSSSGGPNLSALPLWIGLYDPDRNDGGGPGSQHAADFIWDSGETNSYRNWNSGEPNNVGNVEYYTAINWHYAQSMTSTRGTWNDAPLNGSSGDGGNSDGPYYGIVEIGTGFPAMPPTVPGAFYGPVVSPINGHAYFILPLNNWLNAQAAAQALGGNLATVRSDAENSWLVTNMLADLTFYGGPNLSTLPLWIGLYDPDRNDGAGPGSQHAADFIWISGDTSTYRNWNLSTSEPNNQYNNEYYTAINWHFAEGETTNHSTWDDTPVNGTTGQGGNSDGPYYGIAEINGAGFLLIGLTNSIVTLTPLPNTPGAVVQSTTNLDLPVDWVPVWTNSGSGPYTITIGPGNRFFRLAN